MSTRLDRLLLLLENGSTPVIRKSAAEQLGDVQKLYPHELDNLLNKVHAYLMSNQWETRVAAGQAVEAIIKNVDQWNPVGAVKNAKGCNSNTSDMANYLSLSAFDVGKVLEGGVQLNMCDARTFDLAQSPDENVNQDVNNRERLLEQKQQLNKKLGLESCSALNLVNTDSLISEEDFMVEETTREQPRQISSMKDYIQEKLLANGASSKMLPEDSMFCSKKRKAYHETEDEPKTKTRKLEVPQGDSTEDDNILATSTDSEEKPLRDWPLSSFSNLLSNNLFNQVWEKRHGSALGLKALVKLHGRGAGRSADIPSNELNIANQRWLEDLCVRLMCVLALDRLGDFLSDEVVAPVRESCAQVIGMTCLHLDPQGVHAVIKALLQLLNYPKEIWEVRHGGLLGIKYVLAVRQDLTEELLKESLPSICKGFADNSDDVRSVAASALLPITNALVKFAPAQALQIIDSLWFSLKELDDLTSSTNSVMNLLSLLISHPDIYNKSQNDSLSDLVPWIWPFLSHNISSVRKAALLTLDTLLKKSIMLQNESGVLCSWINPILANMSRLLFQRALIEHDSSILELVCQVWSSLMICSNAKKLVMAVGPYFSSWMCLTMHPSASPLDRNLLLMAVSKHAEQPGESSYSKDDVIFLGGVSNIADSDLEKDTIVVRARLTAARLLGQLCHKIADKVEPHQGQPVLEESSDQHSEKNSSEAVANDLSGLFQVYLNSKSGVQRMACAWVIKEWAEAATRDGIACQIPPPLVNRLKECLKEVFYFDEIASKFTRLQAESRAFMASLTSWGAVLEKPFNDHNALLTLEQISHLCNVASEQTVSMHLGGFTSQQISAYQKQKSELEATLSLVTNQQEVLVNRVQCSIASVLVELNSYPESLNPIIRPLMDSIKSEENIQLQEYVAEVLGKVVENHKDRTPCPNAKIVKNLCSMYCADAVLSEESWDKFSDILVLKSKQQMASSWKPRKYGPHKKMQNREDVEGVDVAQNNTNKDPVELQKRGSNLALVSIARRPGPLLHTWVPDLWKVMFMNLETVASSAFVKEETDASSPSDLKTLPQDQDRDVIAQDLLKSLIILNLVAPHIDSSIQTRLIEHFPNFLCCVEHPYTAVRHAAGRCLATVAHIATEVTMEKAVAKQLVPWVSDSMSDRRKMGAIEAISLIVEELNVSLVPYLVSLVLPMLGAMSDSNPSIRLVATNSFATLVRLMPLDKSLEMDNKLAMAHPDPTDSTQQCTSADDSTSAAASKSPSFDLSVLAKQELMKKREQDQMFLEQLLNPKAIEDFQIPVKLKVDLRRYQQDGVNWLAFLSRYKLHGILCDDMGLGKTLQSLCIIVADHYKREQALKNGETDEAPSISLVVCPPTLTAHWLYEVEKVVPSDIIRPLHYIGSPSERTRLQKYVSSSNLVLASYDVIRNDIQFFSKIKFNYCILDEGHVIKNNKTKLAKAIKQLQCSHRLILSGTPIQNNVLELWSLFDFLMPGYLGTEKQFQVTFGRPILASRDARSSSKEQEAGTLALESLHRQVLPFMLRRLKEDVLKDLPPKIISNYYCDLSPMQVRLYEDFSKQHINKSDLNEDEDDSTGDTNEGATSKSEDADGKKSKRKEKVSHIFQALQYLRKVCNHPMLALNRHDDESLKDISHTSKLVALKQLLNDCGIGVGLSESSASTSSSSSDVAGGGGVTPVVSQHRVILFCQMKIMLDIIERDLFKRHMTSVTYLRLDGSIPAANRLQIVHRFNNDPSIDVLLLTTQVGGLGLNLTGADTVVFYDHDWNPMKDVQAMDRAHRIGQKKVVTVYKLITRGTLEEKIMGLQKFKMNIAQSVVNQDNHSLASMGSNQLLDLFSLDKPASGKSGDGSGSSSGGNTSNSSGGSGRGLKSLLEDLDILWDDSHYNDEYNVDTFVKSLD